MTAPAKIDVLAVMDKAAAALRFAGAKQEGVQEVIDARDAMRELIEAIEQYRNDFRTERCPDKSCRLCRASKAADDRLRAALAKVQP